MNDADASFSVRKRASRYEMPGSSSIFQCLRRLLLLFLPRLQNCYSFSQDPAMKVSSPEKEITRPRKGFFSFLLPLPLISDSGSVTSDRPSFSLVIYPFRIVLAHPPCTRKSVQFHQVWHDGIQQRTYEWRHMTERRDTFISTLFNSPSFPWFSDPNTL